MQNCTLYNAPIYLKVMTNNVRFLVNVKYIGSIQLVLSKTNKTDDIKYNIFGVVILQLPKVLL